MKPSGWVDYVSPQCPGVPDLLVQSMSLHGPGRTLSLGLELTQSGVASP